MGIVLVEPLHDELGVRMIGREHDRLAELAAAFDLQAVLHHIAEHLIDRVLVEQPAVQRGGIDLIGHVAGALGGLSVDGAASAAMGAADAIGGAAEGVFETIMEIINSIFDG